MLVLSRKQSQRIKVGDSIVVTVVRLSGDKVRLRIEAPDDMLVLREELATFPAKPKTAAAVGEEHPMNNCSISARAAANESVTEP